MYFTAIFIYHRQSHFDKILIELLCELPRDPFPSSGREKQLWNETGQKASQRICWVWSSEVKCAGVCGVVGELQSVSERRSSLLLFLSFLRSFHRHIAIGYPFIRVWSRADVNMKTKMWILLVKISFEFPVVEMWFLACVLSSPVSYAHPQVTEQPWSTVCMMGFTGALVAAKLL